MSNQDHIPEHSEGPVANEQPATVLTPEWQEQCCDNAKRTGFIGLDQRIYSSGQGSCLAGLTGEMGFWNGGCGEGAKP